MSGKAGSVIGIIVGILVIAFNFYNPAAWVAGLAMIAGGAVGLASGTGDIRDAQAQDFEIAMASTGNPIPVVFGVARVTPNFLRVSRDTFVANEIQEGGGKGGGGSFTSGFEYFLTWEFGYCMGQVDAIGQVWVTPSEMPMIDAENPRADFATDELELSLATPDGETDAKSGIVRFYRGSPTQTRNLAGDAYQDGLNYRQACWALCGVTNGFKLGGSAFVPTLSAEIYRLPVCIRDDGSEVTGLKRRGSDDPTHASYQLANPAAIVWESMTNKVWGAKISSDLLNESVFVAVSEFYAENNIGLGLLLDRTTKLDDWIPVVLQQCASIRIWDGEQYSLKCLLDVETLHETIITLRDTEIQSFEVTVPTVDSGLPNALTGEFVSTNRHYKMDVVEVQDLGAMDVAGQVRTQRIQLQGFVDHGTCFRHTARILAETSTPRRSASWTMNRMASHVQPGDCVRVIWSEFAATVTTSYWIVTRVKDEQGADIRVEGIEDLSLPSIDEEETDVTVTADQGWQHIVETSLDDIAPPGEPPGENVMHVAVFEPPPIVKLAKADTQFLYVLVDKFAPDIQGVICEYSRINPDPDPAWHTLGSASGIAYGGTLHDNMEEGEWFNRSSAGVEIELYLAASIDPLVAINLVDTDDQNLEDACDWSTGWFLVVNDEVIAVGRVELVSGKRVRIRNFVRAMYGTKRDAHASGAVCYFVRSTMGGVDTGYRFSPGDPLWMLISGTVIGGIPFPFEKTEWMSATFDHAGTEDDTKFQYIQKRPLSPELVSSTDAGANIILVVRWRTKTNGIGAKSLNAAAGLRLTSSLGIDWFYVWQFDNTLTPLTSAAEEISSYAFDNGNWSTPHKFTVTVPKRTGAALLRIYSRDAFSGYTSKHFAEIAI